MKRLFYFTGYRLSVLHWKGRTLAGTSSFEPTEEGLAKFRSYLQQTEKVPGKFLVDVIEEDFRNETIPHVGTRDRKAVVSRLLDRYYRSSQEFSYSEIIGRTRKGRKDDIVLLGAMTNPQLIRPWLNIIEECEVPLSGIWTLPIISKKLLKTIKATSGVVLLVSQQVNSNVRQTLFRDGKLVSSRQSIINQDMKDISGIGELAAPEVNRTIDFLRAQNLVDADEVINLHIIGSDEQLVSLEQYFKAEARKTVTIHRIADLHKKLGIEGVSEKFSDGLFAWLSLGQNALRSHYGSQKSFQRYHNKLAAAALYAFSLLVIISGVLITEANISDALEYERSITLLKQEENNYREIYSKKFKDFEGVFQNAGVMNSAVDLSERIKLNSDTSPLDFLISLSKILEGENGDLHIDKIEWEAINMNEKNDKVIAANFTGKQPVDHYAIVTGRIDVPESHYRESVNRVQNIISRIKENARVKEVEVLSMPVDLRSESRFTTESGVDRKSGANKEMSGIFSLKVIMKAPQHV